VTLQLLYHQSVLCIRDVLRAPSSYLLVSSECIKTSVHQDSSICLVHSDHAFDENLVCVAREEQLTAAKLVKRIEVRSIRRKPISATSIYPTYIPDLPGS